MPKTAIELRGLPELARGTEDLFSKVEKSVQESFARVADERALIARGRVPYDSGALAASVVGDEGGVSFGGESVPYAGWIEYGGRREGGRNSWAELPYSPEGHYVVPTALAAEEELQAAAETTTTNEIRGYLWPNVPK